MKHLIILALISTASFSSEVSNRDDIFIYAMKLEDSMQQACRKIEDHGKRDRCHIRTKDKADIIFKWIYRHIDEVEDAIRAGQDGGDNGRNGQSGDGR